MTDTCPRAKSDMTPCVLKDGETAIAFGLKGYLCVGCDWSLKAIGAPEPSEEFKQLCFKKYGWVPP